MCNVCSKIVYRFACVACVLTQQFIMLVINGSHSQFAYVEHGSLYTTVKHMPLFLCVVRVHCSTLAWNVPCVLLSFVCGMFITRSCSNSTCMYSRVVLMSIATSGSCVAYPVGQPGKHLLQRERFVID